jgi:SAM-dependent methyltransferase
MMPSLVDGSAIGIVESWAVARGACDDSCFCYHAPWKLFCRANVKGQPRWHAAFFRRAAARVPRDRDGRRRILICGAADEQMLRLLDGVLGGEAEIDFIDSCATPLELAEHWAKRNRRTPPRLLKARVEDCAFPRDHYDGIFSDGLFSFMSGPSQRAAIVQQLHATLRPGGLLAYSTRVTRDGGPLEYELSGRLIQAAAAFSFAVPWRDRIALARRQLRTARTSPFSGGAAVREAFAGFRTVEVETDTRAPSAALRAHLNFLRRRGSICVRVLAFK